MPGRPSGWPVLVRRLRDASAGLREAARQTRNQKIYFPPQTKSERQPVTLQGPVSPRDIADLVDYIADMLEP